MRLSFGVNQYVRRLDVPVDDELGVRMRNRFDDFGEELNRSFGFELFVPDVTGDGLALNVFNGDIGLAAVIVVVNTGVVESCNAWVF